MEAKKTRVRLSYEQKRALCAHHEAHPQASRRMLYDWATAEFQLSRSLAPQTLADTFKRTERHATLDVSRKASHKARAPQIEAALVAWIDDCKPWKFLVVTGAAIREKAETIRGELVQDCSAPATTTLAKLMFSKGWLFKFQTRHGLKSRRAHGEAGLVGAAAVAEGWTKLQSITSSYAKRDIYNMDETAYFYRMSADKTMSKASIPGRKKNRKRITVAVTSNADAQTRCRCFSSELLAGHAA